ncbi:MAG: sulfatase-like hydrolase/transferase [Pseudomonadota bacterium]
MDVPEQRVTILEHQNLDHKNSGLGRRARNNPDFFFYAANYVLIFLLHLGFVASESKDSALSSIFYAVLICMAQAGTYTLVLYILGRLLNFSFLTRFFRPSLLIAVSGFLSFFLLIDNIIYRLYRFHFNGLIVNVLSGIDGIKSMGLVPLTYYLILSSLVIFLGLQVLFYRLSTHRFSNFKVPKMKHKSILVAFFLLISMEKTIFATADIRNDTHLTLVAKIFPLYFPLYVKNKLGFIYGAESDPALQSQGQSKLNYPPKTLAVLPTRKRYNVLEVVIDGWRFDKFSSEDTPFLFENKSDFTYFNKHVSGGNGTRHGIFSLLYGIDSYYWPNFLLERQSPHLFDLLQKQNYKFKISSATSLNSPEFRSTAFVHLDKSISDTYAQTEMWQRDQAMTNDFNGFLDQVTTGERFFGFILFGSTHTSYSFPPDFAKFSPIYPPMYRGQVWNKEQLTFAVNSYRNSIFYVDSLIKSLVANLKKRNLYDSTILIVTGDHGEEFFEKGFLGHHSAYTDYQIRVPMLIRHPDFRKVKEVSNRTIHQDITAMLLEMFYDRKDISEVSTGFNPFLVDKRPSLLSCSFYDCGILLEDGVIVFGTEAHTIWQFDARDTDYKIMHQSQKFISSKSSAIVDTLHDISRFLK